MVGELIVVVTMLGVIGAAATGALTQQGRVRMRIVGRAASEMQLREALAPLVVDLGAASPGAGDFPGGQARDSVLELRATTATGHVCGIAPPPSQAVYVSMSPMERGRTVAPGDTAWSYERRSWRAARIEGVEEASTTVAGCTGDRILRATFAREPGPPVGTPLRFTRRVRYSFYRASDGRTYLGLREWTASSGTLSGVQPVAGPFERTASRFRYFDTLGVELASGAASGGDLGSIEVVLRAAGGARAVPGAAVPPASVTIGLRNRP